MSKSKVKQIICTQSAPRAIGPYSQGNAFGDLVFFSGQIAINPASGKLCGDGIAEQTEQIIRNIDALLTAAGLSRDNVLKTTVYITDMSAFATVNEIYGNYFCNNPPARSCVEVSALPMGAKVEIEVIAHR